MKNSMVVFACFLLPFTLGSCTEPGSWAEVDEQYRFALSGRAWNHRLPVTVDSTGVLEELHDFPLLITLTPSDIDIRACGPEGRALQFRDTDGSTVLAHEVDTWDPHGESRIWVKVPAIPADDPDTRLWIYYDNPYASEPDRSESVWSNGYLGVWHLNEPNPGFYKDSTQHRWNGQPGGGSFTTPDPAEGRLGGAQEFQRITDTILLPARPGLELAPFTLSFWIRAAALPSGRRIFHKGALNIRSASAGPPHKLAFEIGFNDGNPATDPDSLLLEHNGELAVDGQWYWYCLTWTGTAECGTGDDKLAGAHVYRNGGPRAINRGVNRDGTGDYVVSEGAPGFLGNSAWNGGASLGRFDEVRLSGVRRSRAWILAEYLSMTDAMTMLGPPEKVSYE